MENNLQTICEALSNKKSVLIKVLNVRDLTSIADYFVLCSTRNQKQSQAAADEVEEKMAELGVKATRKEGYREGDWILLDFGDVIVHIFTDEERRHYDFDTLNQRHERHHNADRTRCTRTKPRYKIRIRCVVDCGDNHTDDGRHRK